MTVERIKPKWNGSVKSLINSLIEMEEKEEIESLVVVINSDQQETKATWSSQKNTDLVFANYVLKKRNR